jgi:hypothetical protein
MATRNPTRRATVPVAQTIPAPTEVRITIDAGSGTSNFKGSGDQLLAEGIISLALLSEIRKDPACLRPDPIEFKGFFVLLKRTAAYSDSYVATRVHLDATWRTQQNVKDSQRRAQLWENDPSTAVPCYRAAHDKTFQAFKQRLLAA